MNEETFNDLKKFARKEDLEIFVGRGKEQADIESLDPKDLYKKVLEWGEQSKLGLCCGIYGCIEPVGIRCKICQGGYCDEHREMHIHSAENDGIILRDENP